MSVAHCPFLGLLSTHPGCRTKAPEPPVGLVVVPGRENVKTFSGQ